MTRGLSIIAGSVCAVILGVASCSFDWDAFDPRVPDPAMGGASPATTSAGGDGGTTSDGGNTSVSNGGTGGAPASFEEQCVPWCEVYYTCLIGGLGGSGGSGGYGAGLGGAGGDLVGALCSQECAVLALECPPTELAALGACMAILEDCADLEETFACIETSAPTCLEGDGD